MITITYVTITFNAEAVLKPTLDSVFRQDYPHIEHLIIDGASKDGTLQLVSEYMEQSNNADNGHKVLVTSEPDGGIYDAMNKGLRSATGDYICFLNAGDTLPAADTASMIVSHVVPLSAPKGATIDSAHETIEAPIPADAPTRSLSGAGGGISWVFPAVLYGNTDIVDSEGHFLYHRRLQPPEELNWKSFRRGMLVCHQAFYARTDFAIATPYNLKYRYSADVDWCIRIMKAAAKEGVLLLNLHATVANYLEEGTTTRHHRASLLERFRIMVSHYGWFTTVLMHLWFVLRKQS